MGTGVLRLTVPACCTLNPSPPQKSIQNMGDAGASERPAWCDALKGLAPADALEAVATPALPEDKGEGRMRRILAAAFVSLEPFEKASGHATAMVFVLIMLSPHGSNIFDLVGHALKASSSVGIPPGVKSVGRNLFGRAHELFVAEVGAAPKAETQEEKAGRLEMWKDTSELLDNALVMLM